MSAADNSHLSEWKGFGFKLVEKPDFPRVISHLQANFYLDEPINKTAGMTPERQQDADQRITGVLNLNHGSFYAYPLDDPAKIAAVLIIWKHEKGVEMTPFEARSPLTGKIRKALIQLKLLYDIHTEHNLDIYPEIFIISTDRSFRGKGLATEMYQKAIAHLKLQGYPLVSSTFSNPLSRKVGAKLGFKQVARLGFEECRNEDGTALFGENGRDHFAIETILELK